MVKPFDFWIKVQGYREKESREVTDHISQYCKFPNNMQVFFFFSFN